MYHDPFPDSPRDIGFHHFCEREALWVLLQRQRQVVFDHNRQGSMGAHLGTKYLLAFAAD
jgi:hypothetical protein